MIKEIWKNEWEPQRFLTKEDYVYRKTFGCTKYTDTKFSNWVDSIRPAILGLLFIILFYLVMWTIKIILGTIVGTIKLFTKSFGEYFK